MTGPYAVLSGILLYFSVGVADVFLSQHVDTVVSWVSLVVASVVMPVGVLAYLHQRCRLTLADYGLGIAFDKSTVFEVLIMAAWLILAWYLISQVFLLLGIRLTHAYPSLGYVYIEKKLLPGAGIAHIFGALYMALAYGVFEEIYYRGLTKKIAEWTGSRNWKIWYVIGSSVLFSLVHWGLGLEVVIANLGTGLMASLFFVYWGDLRPLIVAHVIYDFIVLITR